jgi:cobalt-zinc-cadmium efflux system outer membrane protein
MSQVRNDIGEEGRSSAEMKVVLIGIILLGADLCPAASLDRSFDDVSGVVMSRTGKRVQWNRGSAQDAEAERYIRAQLKRPLTASSAVQIALLNNHELQAIYEEIGLAQADLIEAGLLKNPLFTIERRFPGQAMEADILGEFIDLLFLPLRKRVAAAKLEATKLRVGAEILNTAAEVRVAFYENQGNQQIADLAQNVEQATAASAEVALQLHQAGNSRSLDLANEEALHVQAKVDFAKTLSTGIESREKLTRMLGLWGVDTSWRVSPRLPDPSKQEIGVAGLESRAIAQRLDLAAFKQETLSEARRLGFVRFEEISRGFEMGGHYEREKDGQYSVGPSFNLPIPFFNFGQAAKARSEAKVRQTQQRYLALAVQIRSEVRSARDRMLLARQRVDYVQSTAMPLRRRVVEESQLQYNAMQVSLFDLLRAKQEEVNAGREYVEALRDYWVARAELEKAVGGSLNGRLLQLSDSKEMAPKR